VGYIDIGERGEIGGWARRAAGLAGLDGLDAGLSARVEKLLAKLVARSSGGQMERRGPWADRGEGAGCRRPARNGRGVR
jgi:hypothetical protein